MASDDLIWKIFEEQSCSYQVKNVAINETLRFCKHPMNVDGTCKFFNCPLARSKYATVIEERGELYLCIKTPERQHLPSRWWEKTLLTENKEEGLNQIEKLLQWWDDQDIDKCRKRYVKLVESLNRMRRLRRIVTVKLTTYKKKIERRLRSRAKRALRVAKLENQIEGELLNRLKQGIYGSIYNFSFNKKEEKVEEEEEGNKDILQLFEEEDEKDIPLEKLIEQLDEEDIQDLLKEVEGEVENEKNHKRTFESMTNDNDDENDKASVESEDSDEDIVSHLVSQKSKKKRKRRKIEIEYENEYEGEKTKQSSSVSQ